MREVQTDEGRCGGRSGHSRKVALRESGPTRIGVEGRSGHRKKAGLASGRNPCPRTCPVEGRQGQGNVDEGSPDGRRPVWRPVRPLKEGRYGRRRNAAQPTSAYADAHAHTLSALAYLPKTTALPTRHVSQTTSMSQITRRRVRVRAEKSRVRTPRPCPCPCPLSLPHAHAHTLSAFARRYGRGGKPVPPSSAYVHAHAHAPAHP